MEKGFRTWQSDSEGRRPAAKSLDTGHDLGQLLTNVRNLGLLRAAGPGDPLTAHVQHVARLWYNNMRFASARAVETRWYEVGELGIRTRARRKTGLLQRSRVGRRDEFNRADRLLKSIGGAS